MTKSSLELIGNTPLVYLKNISKEFGIEIFGKCEFLNPFGSIKDRVALAMIEDGIKKGKIAKDSVIIESTSGNTGIALAGVCACLKLKCIIVMPESMSAERRKILELLGAKVVLTPADELMVGAIKKAKELAEELKNAYMPNQFENFQNPLIHKKTTAKEILRDIDEIDIFICGVGTGGTISGIGEVLKETKKNTKVFAVEPQNCAFLSQGTKGTHKIEGIGAGFKPKILNTSIIDDFVTVNDEEAFKWCKELPKKEGIMAGISAGANIAAIKKIAHRFKGKKICTVFPDRAERYLSNEML